MSSSVGLENLEPSMPGWGEVIEAEADQLWQKAVSLTEVACGRFHEASSLVRINCLAAKHLPISVSTSRRSGFVENPVPSRAAQGAITAIRAELIHVEDSLGARHVCALNARAQLVSVLECQGMLDDTEVEWQKIVEGCRWGSDISGKQVHGRRYIRPIILAPSVYIYSCFYFTRSPIDC